MKIYRDAPSGAVDRAHRLRRDMTDAERILWRALRKAFPEAKLRRQTPIGPYIADFLTFRHKLVIEIDGSQHAEALDADARRTRHIEAEGFRVIRCWNSEVMDNLDGVLDTIASHLDGRPA